MTGAGPRWTKEALAARVEHLGAGPELERFAAGLSDEELEFLQAVLIERSDVFREAMDERFRARGWLRRQWDRADPRGR